MLVKGATTYHVVSYDAADKRGIHLTYHAYAAACKDAARLRMLLKSIKDWGPVVVYSSDIDLLPSL